MTAPVEPAVSYGLLLQSVEGFEATARAMMRDAWIIQVGVEQQIRAHGLGGSINFDADCVADGPTTALGPFADRVRAECIWDVLLGIVEAS